MQPYSLGQLAVWSHLPAVTNPVARVIMVHGICEHSGRHLPTVSALLKLGIHVIRFDLRGAGMSGGHRQYIDHFEDYVEDVAHVFNYTLREFAPKLPIFVLGHSLGGAVAINFASQYDQELAGVILSAPAYQVGDAISPLKVMVGKWLARLTPTLRIPAANDFSGISHIPEVLEEYRTDPLACHFNTVKQGREVIHALPLIPELAKRIHSPVLMVHGTDDPIIRLEGSFEIVKNIGSRNKTMHIYAGVLHEPHNDIKADEYFRDLGNWFDYQLADCARDGD